jgi:menaquinone-dependent protoporphyrinogen oxidase
MKVLVAHASAYGSTRGVAARLADRLRSHGLEVDLRPVDEVTALDDYEAVVVGSAIHSRAWLPQASAFVESNASALGRRAVWMFSVSSVGETTSVFGPRMAAWMRRASPEPPQVTRWRPVVAPRDHRNFAGVVERGHWGALGSLFIWLLRGSYGDHRDWADIDAWADTIAVELGAERRDAGTFGPTRRGAEPLG